MALHYCELHDGPHDPNPYCEGSFTEDEALDQSQPSGGGALVGPKIPPPYVLGFARPRV